MAMPLPWLIVEFEYFQKGEVVLVLMASAPGGEDDFHFTFLKILPPKASSGLNDCIAFLGARGLTACDPLALR
ncbi:MAG: hypothetical protein FalmKO_24760 [Falsiruegeria mediterranea]